MSQKKQLDIHIIGYLIIRNTFITFVCNKYLNLIF